MVITLASAGSIQRYIFGTNRLRENVGASLLVRDALKWWKPNPALVYVGGGNAALAFDGRSAAEDARKAVENWSRECYKKQPGLHLVAGHGEGVTPYEAYRAAERSLGKCADAAVSGAIPGALPVVRHCAATGLAASEEMDGAWLSREAAAKVKRGKRNREEDDSGEWCPPADLGDLGTVEGESPIAVIHADANGFGKMFNDEIDKLKHKDLTEFRLELKKLSDSITTATRSAFRDVQTNLFASRDKWANWGIHARSVKIKTPAGEHEKSILPLLPLIVEADDLTFVTHGKLGLALAADYLQRFPSECERAGLGTGKSACAGVLICHQKFPFSRAYDLAEELCAQAKKCSRLDSGSAYLDFHILQGGVSGSLGQLRSNAYGVLKTGRPIRVDTGNWMKFHDRWKCLSGWPRSRAKGLIESFANGTNKTYVMQLKSRGISPPSEDEGELIAAIEALDYHVDFPFTEGGSAEVKDA
jgi:hypothetical protein